MLEHKLAAFDSSDHTQHEDFISNLSVGNFFYMNKKMLMSNLEPKVTSSKAMLNYEDSMVVCVLATNKNRTKFIVQPYLKISQIEIFKTKENTVELSRVRKFFNNEVFKSDMYALINIKNPYAPSNTTNQTCSSKIIFKQCFVLGIKEYLQNHVKIVSTNQKSHFKPLSNVENDLYVCESMYSTNDNYFRKLNYKKWQPLKFIGGNDEDVESNNLNELRLELSRKVEPSQKEQTKNEVSNEATTSTELVRSFLDSYLVENLKDKIEKRLGIFLKLTS